MWRYRNNARQKISSISVANSKNLQEDLRIHLACFPFFLSCHLPPSFLADRKCYFYEGIYSHLTSAILIPRRLICNFLNITPEYNLVHN